MGEATLEQALRKLGSALIAEAPFGETVQRVADLAGELGVPAGAVELRLVDERGRTTDEVWIGDPARAVSDRPADRLVVPLEAADATVGTLTVHAVSPGSLTSAHAHLVEAFAEQAAAVLSNARAYWDLHEVASGLQAAMQSRAVIEQAKGKLMALEGCSADEAFTMLSRASQRDNVKLRELARRIVEEDGRL